MSAGTILCVGCVQAAVQGHYCMYVECKSCDEYAYKMPTNAHICFVEVFIR